MKDFFKGLLQWSKILTILVIIYDFVILKFVMGMLRTGMDSSTMIYLITSSEAMTTIILSFYFNKAKAENTMKIQNDTEYKIEDTSEV